MSARGDIFAAIVTGEPADTDGAGQPAAPRAPREMFADIMSGHHEPPADADRGPRSPAPNPAQGASGRAQPIAPAPVEMFVDMIKTLTRPASAM